MSISRQDAIHVARLARLELTDDEIELYAGQLSVILQHAAAVTSIDTSAVVPTAHPVPLANVLRDDEPGVCLDTGEFLNAAPDVVDRQVRVPRILGDAL